MNGDLNLLLLGDNLVLFEFENVSKAESVSFFRSCLFEGRRMKLEWWEPDVGYFKEGACISEVWLRVLGLPVHL